MDTEDDDNVSWSPLRKRARLLNSLLLRGAGAHAFPYPKTRNYFRPARSRNVRDKLHEHMPYDVTENGRMHLFSFPGHVTTARAADIYYALPYTYIHGCTYASIAQLCGIHPARDACGLRWISRLYRTTCLTSRHFNLC